MYSVPSASNVKCYLAYFPGGHIADPPKSQLDQWHQCRVLIGWWGPKIALTESFVWAPWLLHECPNWFLPPLTSFTPLPILPTTFQNHDWNNSTNGECQLGGKFLSLLPLPL